MNHHFFFLDKLLSIAILPYAVMGSSVAQAAESESYTINLAATVPSGSFHVIPVDTGWIGQTQNMIGQTENMEYDTVASKLKVLEKKFHYINTAGAIQGMLTGNLGPDGRSLLSNGSDTIPLTVTYNNVPLSKEPSIVVAPDDAKTGGFAMLRIFQHDDKALMVSGSFTGSVAMIFEPVVLTRPSAPSPAPSPTLSMPDSMPSSDIESSNIESSPGVWTP